MNKKKKHYLIYQITNNINQKFYIGKHETYNIDDDYFGSGKYLQNAIEKHGIENFTKTILFKLQNQNEMNLLEKMVVTPEFCAREDTYNINVGGDGGWNYVNQNPANTGINHFFKNKTKDEIKLLRLKGGNSIKQKIQSMTKDEYQQMQKFHKCLALAQHEKHPNYYSGQNNPMYGKHHSAESRKKMSENHKGEKNPMRKRIWICNDKTFENKVILKSEPIPYGWRKGRIGKLFQKQSIKPNR